MAGERTKKFLDIFGIGTDQDYEDEDMGDQDEYEEAPVSIRRNRRDRVVDSHKPEPEDDDEETNLFGKPKRRSKVVPIQTKQGSDPRKSVLIYAPVSYNESQKLVVQLKMNKQIIVKLESLDVDIAQRILDFMSGAAYALDAQVTKISKGIYLFSSNDTEIEKKDTGDHEKSTLDGFYTLEDSREKFPR